MREAIELYLEDEDAKILTDRSDFVNSASIEGIFGISKLAKGNHTQRTGAGKGI
ncbi:MAG: hypothetical protein LBH74_04050 [Nitrososphaerota archaeon]|nr:hypothetical protein [Nitrososphaerota archaeon]